jgi:putative hydrolase of the HAD superfamily
MKKYEHIFFDLDNTLWDFSANSKKSLEELYIKYKFDQYFNNFEEFYKKYENINNSLWNDYRNGSISKDTLAVRRFSFAADLKKDNQISPQTLNTEYLALTTKKSQTIEHAQKILAYLHSKYKVHIITDGFFEVQVIKLRTSKLSPYITNIITAEEIGFLKPNKKLFDFALEKTGATHKNSIMIGDDYENDIIGAYKAGIDQIFFNKKNIEIKNIKPTYTISNLIEIKDIL